MKYSKFKEMINEMAASRMGLQSYSDYLKHKTRNDKLTAVPFQ